MQIPLIASGEMIMKLDQLSPILSYLFSAECLGQHGDTRVDEMRAATMVKVNAQNFAMASPSE